MADNKKYIINVGDQAEEWTSGMYAQKGDSLFAKYKDAEVFEVEDTADFDEDPTDHQYIINVGDESEVWDGDMVKEKGAKLKEAYPDVKIQRVSYKDYWGEQATANRVQRALLAQPDQERNAKLADLGYYDDITGEAFSYTQSEEGVPQWGPSLGLQPLSSIVGENEDGTTSYADPKVAEFFANDTSYTDRQAEIARLDAEYESNPSVIAQREYEAQWRADQAKYNDTLEAQIRKDAEADGVGDAQRRQNRKMAPMLGMGNPMLVAQYNAMYADAELPTKQSENYASALNMMEKIKELQKVSEKGFGGATLDVAKEKFESWREPDIALYNRVGDILTNLEAEFKDEGLTPENLTPEVLEQHLSNDEKALILAFFQYNSALQDAQQDMSAWYKGGKIFAESVPFMLEFLATGGLYKAAGSAATKGMAGALKKWVLGAAKGSVKRTLRKGAAVALRDLVYAGVGTLARTVVSPGTYNRMAEESVKIEDGHLDRTKNVFKSFADSYIENLSEISGGLIGKGLGLLGKGIGKAASMSGIPFSKLGSMLADNRLMQTITAGWKSIAPKFEALGFHGIFEEVGEEYIGNAIREFTIQPGALAEMHKDDNFGAMLIGFAPMTLFGGAMSAVSIGAKNIEAANLGKKLRETLGQHYSEEQIDHMMNLVSGAENSKDVWEAIKPLTVGLNAEEAQQLFQYGAFMAQNKAMLFAKKAQDDNLAQAKRAELQQTYNKFWQQNAEGAESVQIATLDDGRTVYVVSEPTADGVVSIIDAASGAKGFTNVSNYRTQEVDGTAAPMTQTWSMDAYLEAEIASERRTSEQARMQREYNEQVQNLQSQIQEGTKINLGTEGNPVIMLATGKFVKDGVIAVDQAGNTHTIGWNQVADAMKQPIRVKTDQQLIDEEMAAIVARNAERRKRMTDADPVMTDAVNESAAQSAEVVAQENRHIPMNEDGTVNEAAFWEQDPEGYVQWNDEQNQDGGADSLQQVAITKAVLTSLLAEAQQAQQTSNPAERKAAKQRAQEIAEKINRLTAIEAGYAERRIAPLRERAMKWKSLTNAPVYIVETEEDLASISGQAAESNKGGARVRGFAKDGKAYIYLPGIVEESEIDAVFMHEAVAHTGLKGLLGQQAFDELCDQVWEMMSPEMQTVFINYPGVNGNTRAAADEYIAHLAETMGAGIAEAEEKTIWQSIIDFVRNILRSMGIALNVSESELSDLIHMAYADLAKNMAEAEDIAVQQQEARVAEREAPSAARQEYDTYAEDLTHDEIKAVAANDFNAAQEAYDALAASAPKVEMGESAKDFIARKKAYNEQLAEAKAALDARQALMDEIARIDAANVPVLTDAEVLEQEGLGVDTQNDDVRMSVRYVPTEKQREMIIGSIMNVTGRTREEAERWLASETSLAAMINEDLQYLDYVADPKYKAIKDNSDYPQGTVDFNNICRKRLPFTRMFTRLQRRFPNRVFTAEELADIRTIMSKDDLMVACGLCYVEDRRQMVGEVAQSFIDGLQEQFKTYANNPTKKKNAKKFNELIAGDTYVPQVYDLTTQEGLDKLYNEHRGIWEAFQAFNNARGQQSQNLLQGYAEYKREILSWSDKKVKSVNDNGGLRIFSYSDFEAHHLIDVVQIIIDCAAKGVKIQGYTKVPEFARAVANTGIKLNRSLIPLGDTGLVDGQLAFDPVEGIDINDPNFLESNDNVGNILIGINDEQIRIAMADPRIHYIIPYHARQKENIRQKLNVGAWTNYISTQNERNISDGKRVKDNINIYTDILTGDVTTDRQFVEKYLQLCKEKGRIPKFDQFLERDAEGNYLYTPGYYKFLVDFKLFDENGKILPQQPVVAEFDDAFNMQILENYAKDERESTGEQMNETYDKIVDALGLDESVAEGEDVRFSAKDIKDLSPEEAEKIIQENIQKRMRDLAKAENFIQQGLSKGKVTGRFEVVLPIAIQRKIKALMGRDFDSHNVEIGGVRHALKNHGEGGKKLEATSIPITEEDVQLIPYIMVAPDRVEKGSTDGTRESVKFLKNIADGYVVVIEKEWIDSADDLDTINMWAEQKLSNAALPKDQVSTSETVRISRSDATKIRKDAENAIEKDVRFSIIAEMDADYLAAVERGDMETAQRLVLEAVKRAMPDTKIVDDKGNPLVVWRASRYGKTTDYTVFEKDKTGGRGFFFTNKQSAIERYGGENLRAFFLNITNPDVSNDFNVLQAEEKYTPDNDGVIFAPDGIDGINYEVKAFESSQIKSAEPVTYDDNGNVIPLSERFNPENEDVRFSVFEPHNATIDEIDGLFREYNMDESLVPLYDKVSALAHSMDLKIRFDYPWSAAAGSTFGDKVKFNTEFFNSLAYKSQDKAHALLHEMIHATTNYAIAARNTGALTEGMKEAVSQLEGIYGEIVNDRSFDGTYGAKSIYEMVAELSNPEFRSLLKEKNLFQRIVDAIKRLLGIEVGENALDNLSATLDYMLDNYDGRVFGAVVNQYQKHQEYTRFSVVNENQAIFVSNAARAVEGIKMEKATPAQWLAMIEKSGGLKAGEDKWMGLSDWLKASDKKTLTKAEVLEFVNEHAIKIEETHYDAYAEEKVADAHAEMESILQDKFNVYRQEYYEQNEDGDLYGNPANDYAIERLREELGDEFPYAIEVTGAGDVYLTFPYEEDEDMRKWSDKLGVEYNPMMPIEGTRLNYTTYGLTNKREIALTVPTIESWNESDDIHFGDAGEGRAVAWIRFGETEAPTAEYKLLLDEMDRLKEVARELYEEFGGRSNELAEVEARQEELRLEMRSYKNAGHKVLVIDEIQSKRHQEGREKGYARGPKVSLMELKQKAQDFEQEMIDKYHPKDLGLVPFASAMRGVWTEEESNTYSEMMSALGGAAMKNIGIPDAPFDKNWHELAMKRMLRYAAENGYDYIAWTKGDQQAERYDIGGVVSEISVKHAGPSGYEVESFNGSGNSVLYGVYPDVSAIAEVYGKELAERITDSVSSYGDKATIDGNNLKVGGEGMRGFYDRMLPAFMNKYGKKWGIKVEDITLPNVEEAGRVMHSVPVTEEMKASVMEGQVMFSAVQIDPVVRQEMDTIKAKAMWDGTFMKAPNGADTNLTEDQWLMVRTKNFINWFGDWENDPENASKVVDENGEPKVVYHQTNAKVYVNRETGQNWDELNWKEKMEWDERDDWEDYWEEQDFNTFSRVNARTTNEFDGFFFAPKYDEYHEYGERTIAAFVNIKNPASREDYNIDSRYSDAGRAERIRLQEAGFDGVIRMDGEEVDEYIAFEPSQIKSATETTGQFSESEDIRFSAVTEAEEVEPRFSVVTDPALLDQLDNEEYITLYRAMQVVDGGLYQPMAGKVAYEEGEEPVWGDPIPEQTWLQSDETPWNAVHARYDKATKNHKKGDLKYDKEGNPVWVFKLNKGNGKSLYANYNPYIHTSFSPLNDQFSEAQDRENLVVVRVLVPKSELTSGYKAEKAHDAVGTMPWHSGPISGVLAQYEGKERVVMLTRYAKINGIVPWTEVADEAMKLFEDTELLKHPLPTNVFMKGLREELERRGVQFVKTDNGGEILEGEHKGKTWASVYGKDALGKKTKEPKKAKKANAVRFSAITPEIDAEYLAAVERGDMEAAQRLVLEAAKLAMPNTKVVDENGAPKVVYHGSPNVFYKFGSDSSVKRAHTAEDTYFFVDDMEVAQSYGKELYPVFLNLANPIVKDFEGNSWNQYAGPITPEELNEWENNRKARKERIKDLQEKIELLKTDYEASIDENNIFGIGDSVILQEIHELESELNMATMLDKTLSTPPTHTYSTTDKLVAGSRDTSDGAIFKNVTDAASPELTHKVVTDYVAYSPSQIKSAEPVTYDDAGNVIPLSERFNPEKSDIRFSAISTPTDNVVAEGMKFSIQDFARLAGNIFQDMPESFRKEAIEETFKRGWDMQSAIFQIPARLAEKENWDEADKDLAKVIREKVKDAMDESGVVMSRPLTTKEALWMLYRSTEANGDSMMDAAKRSIVAYNLGFDPKSMALKKAADDIIRYSVVRNRQIDAATDMYNYEANLWTSRLAESWLDMNQSVIALQDALEKASGKPIASWENVVLALNQLSSKSYAEKKKYLRDFLMPLWDQIIEMTKVSGLSIEQIERYMMLKHGLERNKKFAMRDAKQFYREMYDKVSDRMKNTSHAEQVVALSEANKRIADIDAQIATASGKKLKDLQEARERAVVEKEIAELVLRNDEQQNEADLQMYFNAIEAENNPKYAEFREKDYGGLTSMFMDQIADVKRSDYKTDEAYQAALLASVKPRFDKVADMEAEAQKEVDDYENKAYMPSLWKLVNAATKETLRHQHAAGVITTEQYDVVRNMFDFYVPLRGFADNTAEDMYSYYMNNSAGGFAKPIIAAKGRKTRAESPLGWIGTMAESAIQQDNKNEVKMKLYYALINRPDTGVLSLSEMWYEFSHKDPVTGKKVFVPAYPPATGGVLTADQMRQHMDAWERSMKAKQAIGEAYKREQGVNLGGSVIFQDKAQDAEHIIRVKVAGKDYAILVNGNPRAAQAINGLLNPDANVGPVRQWYGELRRGMSALMTSFSPLFWVANFQRDLLSSFMRTSENEGWGQAFKYLGNRFHGWKAAKYVYAYENGTMGDSYYEKLYKEFAENGGITGYTSLTTNKEYEKLLADYAKNVDKEMLNWIKGVWDKFMGFGEAIEQVSRFAAYITARESGKSIEEAVAAAKEVSVNFNRKGSTSPISLDELEKLRDKNGKPLSMPKKAMAIALSAMPAALKELYFFFNASIQALSSSAKLARKSPGKAMAWAGAYMGLSIGLAFLNYLLAGDDDEEEYLDLPDYLRHSTALIKVSDEYYLKWSLPQEMRPFYATADILVSKAMGKMPHKNVGSEILLSMAEWLPVNPFGTEDPILALVPDVAAPLAEIKANQNSFGGKIYDDMSYRSEEVVENIPAYRKGTSKTGKIYVDMAELLNDISGGDEVKKGAININPAIVEHLVEGYGGGIYDFGKMMIAIPGMILDAIEGEGVEVRDIPFVNKVILSTDETNMYSHTNDAFNYYRGVSDNAQRIEKEYFTSDDPARAEAYRQEDDWRIHLLYKQYEEDFKDFRKQLDEAVDETEISLLREQQNAVREQLLNDIANGVQPDPLFEAKIDMDRKFDELSALRKAVTEAAKKEDAEAAEQAQKDLEQFVESEDFKRYAELRPYVKAYEKLRKATKEAGSAETRQELEEATASAREALDEKLKEF